MSQANFMELAQQGDPKAIATVLNRSLQSQGVTAKVIRKNDSLQVLLESAQIPAQKSLVPLIYKEISNLRISSIQTIKVYGRKQGDKDPSWQEELEVPVEDDLLLSELEHVMAEDPDYHDQDQDLSLHQDADPIFEDLPMANQHDDDHEADEVQEEYDETEEEEQEQPRSRQLSKPLLILLLLLIPLGLGIGVYLNWSTITAALPFLGGSPTPPTSPAPVASTPPKAAATPVGAAKPSTVAAKPTPVNPGTAAKPTPTTPATAIATKATPTTTAPVATAKPTTPAPVEQAAKPETANPKTNAAHPKLREAVKNATDAANLTQNATSKEEWNTVASKWQAAINAMKAIPKDSPNYAIAQDRIPIYQHNLEYAQQNAENGI